MEKLMTEFLPRPIEAGLPRTVSRDGVFLHVIDTILENLGLLLMASVVFVVPVLYRLG
jgi:hypothetical protein